MGEGNRYLKVPADVTSENVSERVLSQITVCVTLSSSSHHKRWQQMHCVLRSLQSGKIRLENSITMLQVLQDS